MILEASLAMEKGCLGEYPIQGETELHKKIRKKNPSRPLIVL